MNKKSLYSIVSLVIILTVLSVIEDLQEYNICLLQLQWKAICNCNFFSFYFFPVLIKMNSTGSATVW